MKRTVIFVSLLLLASGFAGAAAVQQWHDHQATQLALQQQAQTRDAQAAAQAEQKLLDKAEARRSVYLNLKSQCDKGKLAYDALPAPIKPKYGAPSCTQPEAIETFLQ